MPSALVGARRFGVSPLVPASAGELKMIEIHLKPLLEAVVSPVNSLSTRRPLLDAIQDRLRSSPYLAVRSVTCVESEDAIRLVGRLPSYYLKQMAQETALRVDGGGRVINEVEVDARPMTPQRRIFWYRSQDKEPSAPSSLFTSRIFPPATAPHNFAPSNIQYKGTSPCSS